jgi:Alkylmercury lyase
MLEIRTAAELAEADVEFQARRRAARQTRILQAIYHALLDRGSPVPVDLIEAVLPGPARSSVDRDLATLDEDDLIQVKDGRVTIAYPFSASPTPFVVRLAAGQTRYVCCAIDALGLAPMLGEPVTVSGRCHHCGQPLAFAVTPDGPGLEAAGIMVWVGRRAEGERRAATGL